MRLIVTAQLWFFNSIPKNVPIKKNSIKIKNFFYYRLYSRLVTKLLKGESDE